MLNRLVLLVLVVFWGTMTWLLWRAEYGGGGESGGQLPVWTVWQRVLTAPDDSTLEIRRHGQKIGTCRWSASVGESAVTGRTMTLSELEAQGRVSQIGSYTLDLDGQVQWIPGDRPHKFKLHLDFTTNHTWSAVGMRVSQRPAAWQLDASMETQTVALSVKDGTSEWEKTLAFGDLQRPEKVLAEFGVPWAAGLLSGVLGTGNAGGGSPFDNLSARLKWDARQDWFQLGQTKVRAYRLSARLLEKFQVAVYLSRVGEVLRIELPDGIVAVNDAFLGY